MIISDEEKHHAATHAMAATLKADLNWSDPEASLRGLFDLGEEKNRLARITADFIRVEREGIRKYKELIKSSRGYYRDLFVVLFEAMIRDSEKHIHMLEFLRERLADA
jgi:bacterioferritin (cytochrome b1)